MCFYGGAKSDFDGHSKRHAGNLFIHPAVYGATCYGLSAQQLPPAGFAEVFTGNTCVLQAAGEDVLRFADYVRVPGPADFAAQFLLANNTIYAPNGQAGVRPGAHTNFTTFQQFQAAGYDAGSVVRADMPGADAVAAWARALLDSGAYPAGGGPISTNKVY